MRRMLPVIAALLIGCEQRQAMENEASADRQPARQQHQERNEGMVRNGVDENLAVTARPEAKVGTGAGKLPPAGRKLRFVGRWATNLANCRALAWRFSAASLDTPAGSHCDFKNVRPVPGGYDIAALCTAESPPTTDKLTLRFAQSAQAMLFESGTIADAGLVYCGD